MITGAAEPQESLYFSSFSETENYFIAHLGDIVIRFKKKDQKSFLLDKYQILTNNTTMLGKKLTISAIDSMWTTNGVWYHLNEVLSW